MSTSIEPAMAGRLFIDGRWRDARAGTTFTVTDPGNEEPVAQVADAGARDGMDALDAADRAGPDWAATPPRERGEVLRRAFEAMIDQKQALAALMTRELGRAYTESVGEVEYAAEFLRWFSEEAVRARGGLLTAPGGQYQIMTRLQPVGPCLFITPWNFPAAMATRKIGPALAAGCTVVLKPAGATPLTALAVAGIFHDAGAPPGVLNVVPTTASAELTGPLIADPRLRKISFTGSTGVGRKLLEQAAANVLRTSMELGGNAPFIVLDDADLEVAVESAMTAKLRNGGQSCVAANRFYVHHAVKDEFCARLAAAMDATKVGYGLDEGVDLGSMVDADAMGNVLALVEDAVRRGATLATGGERVGDRGAFLAPTLLVDVPKDARCMSEEVFGPVAPVTGFDTMDEVIGDANATPFGLVAYVQGRDLRRALSVADRIECGMVAINRGKVSEPAAPFGGWKHSGLGREGGHEGLLEYVESKYICTAW